MVDRLSCSNSTFQGAFASINCVSHLSFTMPLHLSIVQAILQLVLPSGVCLQLSSIAEA